MHSVTPKRFAWENDDRQQQKDKERNDLVGKAEALEVDLDYCKHLLSENDRKFSEFQKERQDLKAKVESLEADTHRLASLRAEYEVAQTLLLAEKNQRQDLLHSYSWEAYRAAAEYLRGCSGRSRKGNRSCLEGHIDSGARVRGTERVARMSREPCQVCTFCVRGLGSLMTQAPGMRLPPWPLILLTQFPP